MIKKIITMLLIIVIAISMGFGICYCYLNLDINRIEEDEKIEYVYSSYYVTKSEFENSISASGSIEKKDEQNYIDEYQFNYSNKSKAEIFVNKGEMIQKNQLIGKGLIDGTLKKINSKSNGKVVHIIDDLEQQCLYVKILNYDSLYFTINMDYGNSQKFNYDSLVYYLSDDGEKEYCEIDFIGYEISDNNTIEIHVVPEKKKDFLPGMNKTFYFVISETDEYLAVSKEAVLNQNGKYIVLINENGEYIEKEIKDGRMSEIEKMPDDAFILRNIERDEMHVFNNLINYSFPQQINYTQNENYLLYSGQYMKKSIYYYSTIIGTSNQNEVSVYIAADEPHLINIELLKGRLIEI